MSFQALVIFLEMVFCKIFIRPVEATNTDILMWVLFAINFITLTIILTRVTKSKEINGYLLLSFFLRIVVLLWDTYARHIFILPNSEGDAVWYHFQGESYAFGSRQNVVNLKHYPFYVGQIYKMIGSQKFTAQYINIFLAMCSVVMVYRILDMLNVSYKYKKMVVLLLGFAPNSLMVTTFLLQESFVSFMATASFYFFTIWFTKRNSFAFFMALAVSVYGALLHIGGIVPAVGFVILYFLINNKRRILRFTMFKLTAVIVMMVVALFCISLFGDELLNKTGGELSASAITGSKVLTEEAGGQYYIGIPGLPPTVDLIVNTPVRMFFFVFSPMPWMWRGPGDILAFFGATVFYILTTITVIKTLKTAKKAGFSKEEDNLWSYMIITIVIVLMAAFMFGWGVSNSGSVLRHREKFTFICLGLYGIAKEMTMRIRRREYEKKNISHRTDL